MALLMPVAIWVENDRHAVASARTRYHSDIRYGSSRAGDAAAYSQGDAFHWMLILLPGNGTRIHSLEGDVLHRPDLDHSGCRYGDTSCTGYPSGMHVFNDNGWLQARRIPALLGRVYSGFRYPGYR